MKRLLVAIAFAIFATSASASPFTLDYTVTVVGSKYQYNFALTLDNHDGSWFSSQSYDWFIIGDRSSAPSFFTEGMSFFTTVPAGWLATSSSSGHNGPTLCYVDCGGAP